MGVCCIVFDIDEIGVKKKSGGGGGVDFYFILFSILSYFTLYAIGR